MYSGYFRWKKWYFNNTLDSCSYLTGRVSLSLQETDSWKFLLH